MSFLGNLEWRYATKKYNGTEISAESLGAICDAIRLAPSSAGTQPYHVVVASGALKDALITSSGQVDKLGASHLFVFCARTDYPARADEQVAINAALQNKKPEELEGLAKTVNATWKKHIDEGDLSHWAAKQAYIALGFALAACTELKIDASPMEGFKPDEFKKILELPDYMLPCVIMAVGYRDPNDSAQPSMRPKMRFPKDDLFDFRH